LSLESVISIECRMNIGNALKENFNLKFELPIKTKVISQCDVKFDCFYFKYLVLRLK
jgi:hypothetical protein